MPSEEFLEIDLEHLTEITPEESTVPVYLTSVMPDLTAECQNTQSPQEIIAVIDLARQSAIRKFIAMGLTEAEAQAITGPTQSAL